MRRLLGRIWRWLVGRVWYLQPAQIVLVQATPAVCMQTLARAARPSTERLHLRNLFTEGRRYDLKPAKDGFLLHTTSRVSWRRGRGRAASVMMGACSEIGEGVTRIDLRARMTTPFLLDVFVLPGWMSLLLISGPLPLPVGVGMSVVVLALSWAWHWYAAVLQAADMTWFVQVALDDLPAASVPELASSAGNVVHADFRQAWQKFYDTHRHEG